MEKIRGVNLGNWLVLEKWMDNNLFSGTQAMDETYLCAELGRPYVHCYEYLDKAFNWSEKYGLKILVELHTVPGGHNGTDNAGICGICIWSTRIEQVNYALWVLEKIAERYGKRFVQFYKPVDEKLAESNTNYSLAFLQEFYRDAYKVIRKHTSAKIVFSDAFELDIWGDFLKEFKDVVLDTHNYLMTADMLGLCQRNVEAYGEHNSAAAVYDLTFANCKRFNEEVQDDPKIYYQSYGSKLNRPVSGRFPLNMTYPLVRHFDGPNDGLVGEKSFAWGEKYEFLETKGIRGISHGDMIDLNRENIKGFDIREFYVQLVADLKNRGF